jgi:uncharacterized membrane protein YjjP (DUF1212 family)
VVNTRIRIRKVYLLQIEDTFSPHIFMIKMREDQEGAASEHACMQSRGDNLHSLHHVHYIQQCRHDRVTAAEVQTKTVCGGDSLDRFPQMLSGGCGSSDHD